METIQFIIYIDINIVHKVRAYYQGKLDSWLLTLYKLLIFKVESFSFLTERCFSFFKFLVSILFNCIRDISEM